MASASHDGPMFALAALAAAILFNAYPGGRFRLRRAFVMMCGASRWSRARARSMRRSRSCRCWRPGRVSCAGSSRSPSSSRSSASGRASSRRWCCPGRQRRRPGRAARAAARRSAEFPDRRRTTVKVGSGTCSKPSSGASAGSIPRCRRVYHAFARAELLVAGRNGRGGERAIQRARADRRCGNRGRVLRVFLSLYLVWTKPGEIVVGVTGAI